MRRDQKRQPLRRKLVDLFPKITARFWIDTRGRLVEQQQFRTMNQAGCEREPLFPSAGELTRELFFAFGQTEFPDTFLHSLPAIFHAVHARDEIEVFFNAQILPETKPLRHITDFAFDYLTFGDDVATKNAA